MNGYANWATWNVALWIQNDEGLYHVARRCRTYQDLVAQLWECGSKETPDGALWMDDTIDTAALDEMLADL